VPIPAEKSRQAFLLADKGAAKNLWPLLCWKGLLFYPQAERQEEKEANYG
jgi:hypothetical protein